MAATSGPTKGTYGEQSIDWPNWVIAIFTVVLASVGLLQWKTLNGQTRYLRYTLRPKLKVRNVNIDSVGSLLKGEPIIEAGTFEIYNSGGSTARTIGLNCKLLVLDKLPMKFPIEPGEDAKNPIALPPGFFGTRSFKFGAVDYAEFSGVRDKTLGLYLIGEITYLDELGLRRATRFCRKFNYETERFMPVKDSDYETDDY